MERASDPFFWIEAGGARLRARWLCPGDAPEEPVLVFLHEGLGCIELWRDFPARLCACLGLRGLVYDRVGYGGSDPLKAPRTPRYLHEQAEEVLPQVLAASGIAAPVLFGHSDGGTIALLFAAAFPDRPRALVVEAAHVFVEERSLAGIRSAVAAYRHGDLAARLARYHGDKTDATFWAWAATWLSPPFRDWNIEAELRRISAPTLVIQGEADEYGTQLQVEAICRGVAGPAEAHLLPQCAHVPHLQAQQQVLRLTRRFLERHLGPLRPAPPPAPES